MASGLSKTMNKTFAQQAWLAVALLFPVALLNYLDRQMLATMKSSMVADIPSIGNQADWGLILAVFKWTYAVLSPIGGFIADRFSRKLVIGISLLTWSAVTVWTGQCTSLNELIAARAAMGISEAFYIPTALALITDWHVGSTRSTAVGIHQTGIYFGQICGGFAGFIADDADYGWRWLFTACGIAGIIYVVPLMLGLRSPQRVEKKAPQPVGSVLSELLGNRNFILLLFYFTLPAIAGWVVKDWMPALLKEKFSLGQGTAGVTAVLYVQIASIVGALIGGFMADRWMKANPRGRIFTSAIGMAMFLPALFSVGNATSLTIAIVGLTVFGFGWGFFDCNNMPILTQITRPEVRATGYGLMNLASISCGGLGDWGFGKLQDQGIALNLIFGAFAGLALLSIFIVLFIKPQPQP
jgi:MFS transporter, Spinster family, sphingosine-1-phosphate transporter